MEMIGVGQDKPGDRKRMQLDIFIVLTWLLTLPTSCFLDGSQ